MLKQMLTFIMHKMGYKLLHAPQVQIGPDPHAPFPCGVRSNVVEVLPTFLARRSVAA